MINAWLLLIGTFVFVIVMLGIPVLLTLSIVFNWGSLMVVFALLTIVEILLLVWYICDITTKGDNE